MPSYFCPISFLCCHLVEKHHFLFLTESFLYLFLIILLQLGFIDYFANDMFEAWDAFGDFPELIELLRSNYCYWQGQQRIREASLSSSSSSTTNNPASPRNSLTTSISPTQAFSSTQQHHQQTSSTNQRNSLHPVDQEKKL